MGDGIRGRDENTVITRRLDKPEVGARADAPARLGRFAMLERIGRGGMGEVWRAYDPKLRREVAIKVVRTASAIAAARTLREARALAQLRHPNVVAVFEVGETESDADSAPVFLAMEYIVGQTLRRWLERPRPWRDVVAVLCDAGRGLAAAHRAGLVHRDFKPENVIVGDDPQGAHAYGRICVVDFGLARADALSSESCDDLDHDTGPNDHAPRLPIECDVLTEQGVVLGTPAYMAPEQFKGAPADPRSDQYAFCVALFEALYRQRPARADAASDRDRAARSGRGRVPGGIDVPAFLRDVVLRGLAASPHERWPTLDALLEALERGQARARLRRAVVAATAIGLAVSVVALASELDERSRVAACERAGASIGESWNDDARESVRAGLAATGASHAATTADKVMPRLDAYAADWQRVRTEACVDAEVRGRWEPDVLERSTWCLDDARMKFEVLVETLTDADEHAARNAVAAAVALTPLEPCGDASRLARLPPPPTRDAEEIRSIRGELARVSMLEFVGEYAEARRVVELARARADLLGWVPLSAAARDREASVLERLGAYAEAEAVASRAYFDAAEAGDWDVAARAANQLVYLVGDIQARPAEGLAWGEHARIAGVYAGDDETVHDAIRLDHLAGVHLVAGDYGQARASYARVLAMHENVLGPDHPRIAGVLNNLAGVLFALGEHAEAKTLLERAVAIKQRALGPRHPDVASSMINLANAWVMAGDLAKGRALYEHALDITEQTLGTGHPSVAVISVNLANVHNMAGEPAEARPLYERALAIQREHFGPEHPSVAVTILNLGVLEVDARRYAEAEALYERALAIDEKALGAEHPDVATVLAHLGQVHEKRGATTRAQSSYERALAIKVRALGPEHPEVVELRDSLGKLRAGEGELTVHASRSSAAPSTRRRSRSRSR